MYSAMDLNYGHLARAQEDNPYSTQLYFSEIDYNTCPESFRRQLSFDTSYVLRNQKLCTKKTLV